MSEIPLKRFNERNRMSIPIRTDLGVSFMLLPSCLFSRVKVRENNRWENPILVLEKKKEQGPDLIDLRRLLGDG